MSSEELYEKKYLKYKAKYFQLKEMEEQMEGGGIFSAVKSAAKTALPSTAQIKSAALTAASAAKTVAASPYAQAAAQTAANAALANPDVQARLAKFKESEAGQFATAAYKSPIGQMAKETVKQTATYKSVASHPLAQNVMNAKENQKLLDVWNKLTPDVKQQMMELMTNLVNNQQEPQNPPLDNKYLNNPAISHPATY